MEKAKFLFLVLFFVGCSTTDSTTGGGFNTPLYDYDIEEKINYIIDQFYDDGKCEVCTQISQQLPIRVIAEQLGVPLSDYESFSSWSDAFVQQLSGISSPEEHVLSLIHI